MEHNVRDASPIQQELDLTNFPPIYVLPTHLREDEYDEALGLLQRYNASISFLVSEAKVFLTNGERKRRIAIELRSEGLWTEEVPLAKSSPQASFSVSDGKKRKRDVEQLQPTRRFSQNHADSTTESETEPESPVKLPRAAKTQLVPNASADGLEKEEVDLATDMVRVLKLSWLFDCASTHTILPMSNYVIFKARRLSKHNSKSDQIDQSELPKKKHFGQSDTVKVLRVKPQGLEAKPLSTETRTFKTSSDLGAISRSRLGGSWNHRRSRDPPALVKQTTTEFDNDLTYELPEQPEWVQQGTHYSCQRSTPFNSPNKSFIEQLKKIRLARKLTSDEIGVRAYSTAIAAIAAYPYTLISPREILSLPGCENKIAALFVEWKNSGEHRIQAVEEIENDKRLNILQLFHEIWGVGPQTAREFYNKGWRDLDDIVEFGWSDLSRIQQIGVKFYDEFLEKIPRAEVEFIESKVYEEMRHLCEPSGVRTCIVGGYRRGNAQSGDADILVSHLDEVETEDLIGGIVSSLTQKGWITHNLIVHLSGTKRSQATRPYNPTGGGHGFDSLDKAMVVWQDPRFSKSGPDGKNPNIHRRVDIIVAPWSKIGCAVLGWSAGTTFERDLRRYAKTVKGWKFDSSGIRDRATGKVIELEAHGGICKTIKEAERKVFKGLGLVYREPWERCTG